MLYTGTNGTILAIAVTCIVGGATVFLTGTSDTGIAIAFGGLLYLLTFFWYGPVFQAWRAISDGDLDAAEAYLDQVGEPGRLRKTSRAYYFWVHGILAREKGDISTAHQSFEQALNCGPRTKNDRALLLLHLASLEYTRGNSGAAYEHFRAAKALPVKPKTAQMIDAIERQLQNAAY